MRARVFWVRACVCGCVMRRVCVAGAVAASGGTGDPASGAVARAAWRGVAFWGAVAVSGVDVSTDWLGRQ